jgi:hypothetical protein
MKYLMLLVIVLSVLVLPAAAQQELAYGDTVTGEISDTALTQEYTFTGAAGDVVEIEMDVTDSELDSLLILRDSAGTEVVRNDDSAFGFGSLVIFELPADDTYTIVATRYQEEEGDSTGAYTLSLNQLEPATGAAQFTGEATYENEPYYVYAPETSGLYTVTYTLTGTDYFPQLRISEIDPEGFNSTVAEFGATGLTTLTASFTLEADTLYIVEVASTFFSFSTNSASYTVDIAPAQ